MKGALCVPITASILLVCLALSSVAFLPSPSTTTSTCSSSTRRHGYSSLLAARKSNSNDNAAASSPWKQQPGETEFAYLKRLQQMASSSTPDFVVQNTTVDNNNPTPKKKSAYVPIEQWNAEKKKANLTWEERVQFDGQLHGNKFKQNEILRKNLNYFG